MIQKQEVYSYKGQRGSAMLRNIVIVILAFILIFSALLGFVLSGAHDKVDGEPQTMIVLGCKVQPWGPSVLLQDRLDRALDYWEDHPDITVIVSGGQGPDEPSTEAHSMADYLIAQGIPEKQLFLEEESHNTLQNLQRSLELMDRKSLDREEGILVVSNGFHLTRVRLLAERVGLENVSTLAAPATHWPSRLKMYIREPLALVKSFLVDR